MDWFLYDKDLGHERVKGSVRWVFAPLFPMSRSHREDIDFYFEF